MPNPTIRQELRRIGDELERMNADKEAADAVTPDDDFIPVGHFLAYGAHSSNLNLNAKNHPWAHCFQRIGCRNFVEIGQFHADPSACVDHIHKRFMHLKPRPVEMPSLKAIGMIVAVAQSIPPGN
jgi:hypothetical protein